MDTRTTDLVAALTATMGRDEDVPVTDYLIDNVAEATALLLSALDEILKGIDVDERTALL